MAGNSQRKGAIRKSSKRPTAGSGGRVRRGLEGKGPTPKAADRPNHKAHKLKTKSERETSRRPKRRGGHDDEWIAGRNAVVEALREGVPVTGVYVAEGAERDGRLRDAFKMAAEHGYPLLEVTRTELDRMTGGAVHQGVDHVGQLVVAAAGGPGGVGRVEAEHVQHRDDLAELLAEGVGGSVGEQPVALADGLVDDGHGRRRAEVVVHRGDERIGHRREPAADHRCGAVEEVLDPTEALGGLVEGLEGELDVRAVVRRHDVEAQVDGAGPLEHRRDGEAVAQ